MKFCTLGFELSIYQNLNSLQVCFVLHGFKRKNLSKSECIVNLFCNIKSKTCKSIKIKLICKFWCFLLMNIKESNKIWYPFIILTSFEFWNSFTSDPFLYSRYAINWKTFITYIKECIRSTAMLWQSFYVKWHFVILVYCNQADTLN